MQGFQDTNSYFSKEARKYAYTEKRITTRSAVEKFAKIKRV